MRPLRGVASIVFAGLASIGSSGCGTRPPESQVPNARAAIDRVQATQSCGGGVKAAAKLDHFGKGGRVRGDMLIYAVQPARLRMDVVSPFGVALATLTSDGDRFALADLREKHFYVGPASACNIARLTNVPMPGHVLVSLLLAEPPVLKHEPAAAGIVWSSGGHYVIRIAGTNGAEETLHIAPYPEDFGKPWNEQRMRMVEIEVRQQGVVLYHAKLDDFRPTDMAKPRVDPDGIDPPIPTSGPECHADLPRRIQVEVPTQAVNVRFRYETLAWNPPLIDGLFTQPVPGGVEVRRVTCDR